MFGQGYLSSIMQKNLTQGPATQFTIGRVIDTNDPQQMGRIRVQCSAWGDTYSKKVGDIPFAFPVSPLAGVTTTGTRGAEDSEVEGPVAYGMWNIPKIGSYVMVGCVDGHRGKRFYIGGIHPQYMTHTMPHGRFLWSTEEKGKPDGPVDTYEQPIEPLYSNLQNHFTKVGNNHAPGTPDDPRANMEWRTRGVDRQVAGINNIQTESKYDGPGNFIADTEPGNASFTSITQEDGTRLEVDGPGYAKSQITPDDNYETTTTSYDSHVYSWTTPGFHSYSMDDRKDNCRIRLRTTSGHQILMDDTNERIYINTAGGETWIEIDQVGNIDIYASKNVSTHAGGDINFYADKTIRMQAREGIHMRTDGEFRAHSIKDFNIRTEAKFRTHSKNETRIESDADMHVRVQGSTFIGSTGPLHAGTEGTMHLSSSGQLNLTSGANIVGNASQVHWNSFPAVAATAPENAKEYWAYLTSRVPEHEPWARVFMKKEGPEGADNNGPNNEAQTLTDPNVHTPEYDYKDTKVGKGSVERGETYYRGQYWKR
jgi:hypothetical protein